MSSGLRRCGSRRPETAAAVGDYDYDNGYVETDPTGRYGRFDEVLGKGATKCVYRGFDEERGVEVAWNQCEVSPSPSPAAAAARLYSEVQLLGSLRHESIMGFQAWWVDPPRRRLNFITELFSSGTLRSYRLRYPRVSLRAVRSWTRQILRGLAYLHSRDPPVIHRDLKCDNLFVHGHLGQVKIGDLGLAVAGAGAAARSVIGTPEFMAPEMYDEEYDERVDVYALGMCVLEMVTTEYPYAECSNPAQIYKKVTAGELPGAFHRVADHGARRFIARCLQAADSRPSAADLLLDPFLLDHRAPPPPATCRRPLAAMTITGKLNSEEDTIFLKVQIADDETGHVRNIYFPFDTASDTAAEVAKEMVKELDITDRDASEIAAMIEQEVHRLVPGGGREQHEYTYDEEDHQEQQPPPLYYLSSSSPASSQGSLYASGRGPHAAAGWSKDDYCCGYYAVSNSEEDETSSVHSGKYSALHYQEGEEQGDADGGAGAGQARSSSRFRPGDGDGGGESSSAAADGWGGRPRRRDGGGGGRAAARRSHRSMVEMRSQVLHRTLVEELNRRLFFNTVAAVESIGFRAPSGCPPPSARGRRRASDDQHCML
ncbi:hypothetical protein ACP4OV_003353 [Aristida adscensionis]